MSEETPEAQRAQRSSWSVQIATVAGIPVRIHVTFLFLVAYVAWVGQSREGGGLWLWIAFILALFGCVVLHEFGHALTAKRFGIKTRDITLYPMGGVAMFEGRMKPREELWIALAGPAVNVVIAFVLGIYLFLAHGGVPLPGNGMFGNGMLYALFVSNIMLAVFNMIPAFPMDGGRVLRALLGLAMDEAKATAIAGTIGQGMAVLLGILALTVLQSPLLALVALFVFMGAGQEMAVSNTRSFLEGHTVREAMQTRFRTIPSGASLQTAAEMLLAGSQHDFPVVAGEEPIGVMTRTDIARGLATEGPSAYVAGYMTRDYPVATPATPLESLMELFGPEGLPVLVFEDERLVGMVTQENLSEFIMLQHAMRQSRGFSLTA